MRLVRAPTGGSAAAAIVALYAVEMLTFFGVMMYESGLIVLLVSLSLLCSLRIAEALRSGNNPSLHAWLRLAAVWGAIPLTRPDATVLVVLQLGALWWFSGGGSWRVLARLLGRESQPSACRGRRVKGCAHIDGMHARRMIETQAKRRTPQPRSRPCSRRPR